MKGMIGERFHASGLSVQCSLIAPGDTRVGFGLACPTINDRTCPLPIPLARVEIVAPDASGNLPFPFTGPIGQP
jgi:hypothetical protein